MKGCNGAQPPPEVDLQPLSPTQHSLSCSPPDLPILIIGDYMPVPDDQTVIQHLLYNLPSLGVVVSLHFHCIICLNCKHAIEPLQVFDHIHKDLPLIEIPEDLQSVLESAYQVVSYSSVIYTP